MPDRMLTTGQVAKMTGLSVRTVCKLFDQKTLDGYRVPGGEHRKISEISLRQMADRLRMPLKELQPRKTKCRKTRATRP